MRPDTLDFIARDEAFAQHCEASPDQHCNFQLTGAVYMSAAAEELTGHDLERGLVVYNGRFPDPARHGLRDIKLEEEI